MCDYHRLNDAFGAVLCHVVSSLLYTNFSLSNLLRKKVIVYFLPVPSYTYSIWTLSVT